MRNCRADTFTLRYGGSVDCAWHRRYQSVAVPIALRSTNSPIGTITPVSSATPMKCAGASRPRSGCAQRTSASKPTAVPLPSATIGW